MGVLNHFLNRRKKKEQLLHQKRHKNENRVTVKVNLTLKHKHFRTHPEFTVPDTVNLYTKGAGNCISRNETVSQWSDKVCTIEKIDRDMILQKKQALEELKAALTTWIIDG